MSRNGRWRSAHTETYTPALPGLGRSRNFKSSYPSFHRARFARHTRGCVPACFFLSSSFRASSYSPNLVAQSDAGQQRLILEFRIVRARVAGDEARTIIDGSALAQIDPHGLQPE